MSHLQLLSGWHEPEGDGWRWVEREFSLGVEAPASEGPCRVQLRLFFPGELFDGGEPVKLEAFLESPENAREAGTSIGAQQFRLAGEQTFVAEFTRTPGVSSILHFRASRTLPPDPTDERERALIVASCKVT
jgi:hypothetical protein